jgi:hypothetical protein
MQEKYLHLFEDFGNLVDVVYTKDGAKIMGGDCNTPRMSLDCNYECNMFCRLVSRVFIRW